MPQLAEIARFTNQPDAMVAFYETMLDTDPVHRFDGGGAIFDVAGVELLVHPLEGADDGPIPPEDHVSFRVDDVDTYCEQLADAGLEVEAEPAEYYWGRSAYLLDPDGRQVELLEE